jgi:hypothetical protein
VAVGASLIRTNCYIQNTREFIDLCMHTGGLQKLRMMYEFAQKMRARDYEISSAGMFTKWLKFISVD